MAEDTLKGASGKKFYGFGYPPMSRVVKSSAAVFALYAQDRISDLVQQGADKAYSRISVNVRISGGDLRVKRPSPFRHQNNKYQQFTCVVCSCS